MYKLYGSIGHWSEIDRSNEEQDIINTITDYIQDDNTMRFIVIKRDNNTDTVVRNINKVDDYIDYIQDFNYKKRVENIGKAKTKRLVK